VIAPPTFSRPELEDHCEGALKVWASGWGERERGRVLLALDEDRRTPGAHYRQLEPWMALALKRAGVAWQPALYLLERITQPPLENPAAGGPSRPEASPAELGMEGAWNERVLTPYRYVATAVLADLGVPSWLRVMRGADPEDEHRRPSRPLFASRACGVTAPGSKNPSRGARNARREGRLLLSALGAWPWALYASGELEREWWSTATAVEPLRAWLQREEGQARHLARQRVAAARAAGLA